MSYSDLIRSDRTSGQRAQDDEDHRLALCGLSFDPRQDEELEDFYSRHYDFALVGERRRVGSAMTSPGPPPTFFALAPQARSRGQRMWEEHLPAGCCMSSGPTPPFLT